MPAKITFLNIDDIIKDYTINRLTIKKIATKNGVSTETISKTIKEKGIKITNNYIRPLKTYKADLVKKIVQLHYDGISVLQISKQCDIARPTVVTIIKREGITIRNGSEANIIRMRKLSPEQKSKLTEKAHEAIRGTKKTFEAKVKNAITKQKLGTMSEYEEVIYRGLLNAGLNPIPQLAVGIYNCDIAVYPVAVEIWGGGWHFSGRHAARFPERVKYFGNAGWSKLIIVITNHYPITDETMPNIIANIKQMSMDKPINGEYRMIFSNGDIISSGSCDSDDITTKPSFAHGRDKVTGRYKRITN